MPTLERVREVFDDLQRRGISPTIEKVRKEIGPVRTTLS